MRFLIVLLLLATCAAAQPIDSDPDGMSFYFDTDGTEYCLTVDDWVPAPYAGFCVTAFLLVTCPDTPFPSIQAWEAHVEIVTNSMTPPLGLRLASCAVNYSSDPYDYYVGFCPCIGVEITGDATVIAWVELSWSGWEGHAEATFILEGVEDSLSFPDGPGYAAEAGFPSPCQPLFSDWGACAWINNDCTTPNEGMSWGAVKSLF